jgi:DNA-binding CsgD family transcriptional regulator
MPIFESLEGSPDGVFVTAHRNRIVFWNPAAERILGYEAAQAVGLDCDRLLKGCDVFDNRYCTQACPVMHIAARSEPVKGFRMRAAAMDGRSVNLDVTILQLSAPAPEHYYLAHILHEAAVAERSAPAPAPELLAPKIPDLREVADVRARRLSAREVEVLGMLAAGRTTPEIADRLHIAPFTARNHIQNILEKLEVHSKSEAIAFAFQKRIL